jgi:hypothetical protein
MPAVIRSARVTTTSWLTIGLLSLGSVVALAQEEAGPQDPAFMSQEDRYTNMTAGEFTPARGFDLFRTERGSLNISVYGLFRYLGQFPANQTFTDHLGNVRPVSAKNDLNWHRTFAWLTGFFGDPRFRYNISLWSLGSTEQTLLFGNLQYRVAQPLVFGVGVGPNLTNRSLQGSWPFWAGSDRQMAEEALRGGFASSFWISGQPIDRFYYTTSINRSLSQLGIKASEDDRNFAFSGSVMWMPTTGEFGPRGGLGDLEHHVDLATRFGASACQARESRFAPNDQPPKHSQIRMSDGVNPFETGALAAGVTVERLTYQNLSLDAGFKLRGFSFQGEYTFRRLSDFSATGPVPESELSDQGFFVQGMHMVVPRLLGLYATVGYIDDEFRRYPKELSYGASYYPYGSRSWRLNLHVIHIDQSPAGSGFGYYVPGQSGTTVSMGTDILL